MKKVLVNILKCIPLLVMMFIIFGFSGSDGEESGSLSYQVACIVSEILEKIKLYVTPESIHLPIRKIAHMSEYAVLFFTALLAYGKRKYSMVVSFIFCVLYAATDEFHQTFVPDRCGCVTDVLIDSAGVTLAFLFTLFVKYLIKKHKQKAK